MPMDRRKSTHFLSRNSKSTHFQKIDANACGGQKKGILKPVTLEAGCLLSQLTAEYQSEKYDLT